MNGGYDEGYIACKGFWGTTPGSCVTWLAERLTSLEGRKVLDIGCGEGKNAVFLSNLGARVTAIDVSSPALANASALWSEQELRQVKWVHGDIRLLELGEAEFDIVLMYGVAHCLSTEAEIEAMLRKVQAVTVVGGYNVFCSFNRRYQELAAHSGFEPTLVSHEFYLQAYASWSVLLQSDSDLHEMHPHNLIPHVHSMTRIVAQRK